MVYKEEIETDHRETGAPRKWFVELCRDKVDLKIELKTKKQSFFEELPLELYMTHTYKVFLKIENYWNKSGPRPPGQQQQEAGSQCNYQQRPPTKLYAHIQVLEAKSLAQVTRIDDPTKPIIEGTTTVEWTDLSSYFQVMKIKFVESNYSKRIKSGLNDSAQSSSSPTRGIGSRSTDYSNRRKRDLSTAQQQDQSEESHTNTSSTTKNSISNNINGNHRDVGTNKSNNNNNNNHSTSAIDDNFFANDGGADSGDFSQERLTSAPFEQRRRLLTQRLENLNKDDHEYYCLRIICFELPRPPPTLPPTNSNNNNNNNGAGSGANGDASCSSASLADGQPYYHYNHISNNSLRNIDIFENNPDLVPVISKISAPIKIFSKVAHTKKRKTGQQTNQQHHK